MAGWYELSKSSDGQFRFVLKAGNAETILTSELYGAKASAENGIASVQTNAPLDERYERKQAANGKNFFNLKAANGQVTKYVVFGGFADIVPTGPFMLKYWILGAVGWMVALSLVQEGLEQVRREQRTAAAA